MATLKKIKLEVSMSKEKLFVGLDVGKDEVVASIRGRKPKAFSHSTDGVNALVKWVRMICGESDLPPL